MAKGFASKVLNKKPKANRSASCKNTEDLLALLSEKAVVLTKNEAQSSVTVSLTGADAQNFFEKLLGID